MRVFVLVLLVFSFLCFQGYAQTDETSPQALLVEKCHEAEIPFTPPESWDLQQEPGSCDLQQCQTEVTLLDSVKDLFRLDFSAEAYPCRVDECREHCWDMFIFGYETCERRNPDCTEECQWCMASEYVECYDLCESSPCSGWLYFSGSLCIGIQGPGC
jgi:hypothetical protein